MNGVLFVWLDCICLLRKFSKLVLVCFFILTGSVLLNSSFSIPCSKIQQTQTLNRLSYRFSLINSFILQFLNKIVFFDNFKLASVYLFTPKMDSSHFERAGGKMPSGKYTRNRSLSSTRKSYTVSSWCSCMAKWLLVS